MTRLHAVVFTLMMLAILFYLNLLRKDIVMLEERMVATEIDDNVNQTRIYNLERDLSILTVGD